MHPRLDFSEDSGNATVKRLKGPYIYFQDHIGTHIIPKNPSDKPTFPHLILKHCWWGIKITKSKDSNISISNHGENESLLENHNSFRICKLRFIISPVVPYCVEFPGAVKKEIHFKTDINYGQGSKWKWIPGVADFYQDGMSKASTIFVISSFIFLMIYFFTIVLHIGKIFAAVLMSIIIITLVSFFIASKIKKERKWVRIGELCELIFLIAPAFKEGWITSIFYLIIGKFH